MSKTRRLEKSAKNLTKMMGMYYTYNKIQAKKGKYVVWIAIVVPIELLKGFDLVIAVPENHSAMCAAKKLGPTLAEVAESKGYSMDLCSYARIDMGSMFGKGKNSPIGGLPKPDLLISNTNNCSLLSKWFDVYHREYDIPHFILDVPFCYERQKEKDLHYIVNQYKDLIYLIEDLTDQKFDIEKVKEAIHQTNKAISQWKRFLSSAAHHPSGISAFDSFVHMAPYLSSHRGTPLIVNHFKLLADETEKRMEEGKFPVPEEKYRLLWDNIAPWHQLRPMSKKLAQLNANIIYATYTSCMGTIEGKLAQFPLDPSKPLFSLARIQNATVCPYGLELRFNAISKMIRRYDIDGVVFTSNFSCKPYSLMQLDLMRKTKKKFPSIPCVMINVDHADVRKYNEEQVFLKIEALLEQIDNSRQK
ncbi:MAG: 2-hydroxyacyl-CoA dehydratase [Candidatus Lokiarchaeota archaeon]|nr:2-hydroxyacyl-CoA dehydratase [Candidatus Lokiarchaeota archaeon]MBD3201821.1 2-hydroxyacyl-CoA dehydratase [Candidatus Lokiarchaeota archaeon]